MKGWTSLVHAAPFRCGESGAFTGRGWTPLSGSTLRLPIYTLPALTARMASRWHQASSLAPVFSRANHSPRTATWNQNPNESSAFVTHRSHRFAEALSQAMSKTQLTDASLDELYGTAVPALLHSGWHFTRSQASLIPRWNFSAHLQGSRNMRTPVEVMLWPLFDKMQRQGLDELIPAWSQASHRLFVANTAASIQEHLQAGKAPDEQWIAPHVEEICRSIHAVGMTFIQECLTERKAKQKSTRRSLQRSFAAVLPAQESSNDLRGTLWRPEEHQVPAFDGRSASWMSRLVVGA